MLTEEQRIYQNEWYHNNKEKRQASARANMKAWRANNPAAAKRAVKKWRDKNPDHLRNYLLKKNYGITLAERDTLFEAQGSKCAICHSKSTSGKGWHVDHCHKTKKVRGILCAHCNLMIGHAKDNA